MARGSLATVARTRGSTPVPVGTKMLVGADGRVGGTVGGGCVEADVIATALDARRTGRPALVTHHLNADLAGDIGLSCGGTVEVFVEPLVGDPGYIAALDAAAAADAGVVTTDTVWREPPFKRFAPLDPAASSAPAAQLSRDGACLIEHLTRPPRVVVFGAGHVGAAIARAAQAAGFRVTVVDDRPEFADPARFPGETTVWAATAEDAVARAALDTRDAVVIATRGHRHDALLVERLAATTVGYLGLLGSKRKKAVIARALRQVLPAHSLDRVRIPVGLPIGAQTPEEIAVSVVAELIAWRRGARGSAAAGPAGG